MRRDLHAARNGRRRLKVAGWLLVLGGVLLAIASDVLVPFFSPFGLAAGVLTMLAGGQLMRLRGPAAAIGAAAFDLLAGIGAGVAFVNHHAAGSVAGILSIALVVVALAVLGILWADAEHMPTSREPDR